jgi:hypothetical protein
MCIPGSARRLSEEMNMPRPPMTVGYLQDRGDECSRDDEVVVSRFNEATGLTEVWQPVSVTILDDDGDSSFFVINI